MTRGSGAGHEGVEPPSSEHAGDRDDESLAREIRASYVATPGFDPSSIDRLRSSLARRPPPRRAARTRGMLPLVFAGGLLAAGIVFAAGVLVGRRTPGATTAHASRVLSPAVAASATQQVHFTIDAPGAREVSVVGDFNGWNASATPLARNGGRGPWEVVVTLRPGLHTYAFVVDRTVWTVNPLAPRAPEDGFGTRNSAILVASRS